MSTPAPSTSQDLSVRGETIQSVFRSYSTKKFLVNRRYQRKLIWTIDEKKKFIDSLANGFPVPIILLAENRIRRPGTLEIIDGMQRLNAITSFIENDYSMNGHFFDLDTMAETKSLVDGGELLQKEPRLERALCVAIAEYVLPLSVYDFSAEDTVDEIFRRINSGGRKLSRQELRAAGSTASFAQAVRKIASKIRGDDSFSDQLHLNDMKKISITNRDLDYGIAVEGIFWVEHNILTKEQIRESRDEELIADIVSFMVSPNPPASRAEFLDDYFGFGENDAAKSRYNDIDLAIQKRTVDLIVNDFRTVLEEILYTLNTARKTFGQLLFQNEPARAPRYFQAVFLALHREIITRGRVIKNRDLLVKKMTNQATHITIQEGGRWSADERSRVVDSVIGMYNGVFGKKTTTDPARSNWILQFENLLSQSTTEQSAYDFKQGLILLDGTNAFDESNFEKICKTCVGISNIRKGSTGYIILGVCDKKTAADRLASLYKIKPRLFSGYFVTGITHEPVVLKKTDDQYFQMIVDKFRHSTISLPLKDFISSNIKMINYYDHAAIVIEIKGQDNVSNFGGKFYTRAGAQLIEIEPTKLPEYIAAYIKV